MKLLYLHCPPGEIIVSSIALLDHEDTPLWTIVVMATDGGNTVRSQSVPIQIIVTDVNDNSPVFSEPAGYVTTVAEVSACVHA